MKLLITSIGKRVQLIKHFKKNSDIVGVDCSELAVAKEFVDSFYKIPRYNEEKYLETLINICKKEKIDFLIPLYEKEFLILCDNRKKFEDIGTNLLLSDKSIIEICNNKWNTYNFFKENNIPSPSSYLKDEIENILSKDKEKKKIEFPLIIKPIDGMGSNNVFRINNEKELLFFKDYVENPIIQEFVEGKEYTIDVFCDLLGNVISAVPRERIEVKAGEVVKSKTVDNREIIEAVLNLCNKLNSVSNQKNILLRGPITIQCMYNSNYGIKFIEINPRLGGGVPLTFASGVDYGKILKQLIQNENYINELYKFKETLMLRYDEAVFK